MSRLLLMNEDAKLMKAPLILVNELFKARE